MFSANKKGFQTMGVLIAIALLLLSAGPLLALVKYTASKADEGFQIKMCRLFNEIKFGIREKSEGLLTSGDPVCSTIDKYTDEKKQVPTSKYNQNKEGAELEMREMIRNTWYMWLDGSQKDMFRNYPTGTGCFVSYAFKLKKGIKGVTKTSLEESMDEPYYIDDKSSKCSPVGGFWRAICNPDEKEYKSKLAPPSKEQKCCIKDVRNSCENKGGTCSDEKPSSEYGIYDVWKCPRIGQTCYVTKDNIYSYTRYIRERGTRGGEIFFKPPAGVPADATDTSYVPENIYAVTFWSPNGMLCALGTDPSTGCYVVSGSYGLAAVAGGTLLVKTGGVIGTAGGIARTVAIKALKMIGVKGAVKTGVVGYFANEFSVLDNILKGTVGYALKPVTDFDVPNFIVVMTLDDAKEIGCIVDYAE